MTPVLNKQQAMTLSQQKIAAPISKQTAYLLVGSASVLLLDLVLTGSWWASSIVLMSAIAIATLVWPQRVSSWYKQLSPSTRRYTLLRVSMMVALATLILHGMAEPAAAQFYQKTEQWLTGIQGISGTGAETIITLAFNLLRGVFVIYLGIAIVKVINAQREGEDWQTMAKTPLIVALAAGSGDAIANLITGA